MTLNIFTDARYRRFCDQVKVNLSDDSATVEPFVFPNGGPSGVKVSVIMSSKKPLYSFSAVCENEAVDEASYKELASFTAIDCVRAMQSKLKEASKNEA